MANLLIVRTPLLIGYSLDDPDFRNIWSIIGNRLGALRRPAYVLAIEAKPSDIARYERRGVKVLNLPGTKKDYPIILERAFREIREYWSRNLPSVSVVMEDRTLADLSLPTNATTRLCLFAISNSFLPFFKNEVYPIVNDNGLTPISVDDVVSPGDSISAKMSAILSRADVIVVESDYKWVLQELTNAPKSANVLVIGDAFKVNIIDDSWDYISAPKNGYWTSESAI